MGMDPLGEHVIDDGFRSGPDHQRFFQFLAAAVSDHGHLGRKTLDVLRLLLQKTQRDEERKLGIARPGLLDARGRVRRAGSPRPPSRPGGKQYNRAPASNPPIQRVG